VYSGDPSTDNSVSPVVAGKQRYLIILKVCSLLKMPKGNGMALTPSKFYDFTADSPAKLLYFTDEKVNLIFCFKNKLVLILFYHKHTFIVN